MNKAQAIRQWLRQNPGKHTGRQINNGLKLQGKERFLYSYALKTLAENGAVCAEGQRKQKRYWLEEPS